jgi:glucose-1-phosphate thymidylyltransferase
VVTKAVILAAGSASRMQANLERYLEEGEELDAVRKGEKMAARFSRFPFLDYQLLSLAKAGVRDVSIVVRPDDAFFTAYYERMGGVLFPELSIGFSFQETPDGTAHAVLAAERFAGDGSFLVLNGDNHYPCRLVRVLVEAPEGLSALVAFDTAGFSEWTRKKLGTFAVLRTLKGRLVDIVEKPPKPEDHLTFDSLYTEGNRTVMLDRVVLVSMNLWRFEAEIMDACRNVPRHAPRETGKPGEYELPDAVKLHMRGGGAFLVYYAREDILDLTRAEDIGIVAEEIRRGLADGVEELERRRGTQGT